MAEVIAVLVAVLIVLLILFVGPGTDEARPEGRQGEAEDRSGE